MSTFMELTATSPVPLSVIQQPVCDPIFEASYSYQTYFGTRSQRLGLFDNPESALNCLLEEGHQSDGEITRIEFGFGAGPMGGRTVTEHRQQIYGERMNPHTERVDRGWLDLRDFSEDPDYLRMLELHEQFTPFLMWREKYERGKAEHGRRYGKRQPVIRFYEARGERDPATGLGGMITLGQFETPEQAIEAVQGKGLVGGHGHVVMVEFFESGVEMGELRTGVWGQRRRLDGPGYEFGYSDYRDFYQRPEWSEFMMLAKRFPGKNLPG